MSERFGNNNRGRNVRRTYLVTVRSWQVSEPESVPSLASCVTKSRFTTVTSSLCLVTSQWICYYCSLPPPPLPPFVHVDLANCHAILILGSCNRIKNLVYEKWAKSGHISARWPRARAGVRSRESLVLARQATAGDTQLILAVCCCCYHLFGKRQREDMRMEAGHGRKGKKGGGGRGRKVSTVHRFDHWLLLTTN